MTRIREFRLSQQMTLRKLAERSQVSPGLISQVERGITDPSLESLRRIAKVLGVPLFRLFQESDDEAIAVIRQKDRLRISSPHATVTYTRASPGRRQLEVLEGSLEPGATSADAPRSHPAEECVVVLAGRLTVEVGATTLFLEIGDSCYYASEIPHRFRNDEDELSARFLISVTPPSY